MGYLAAGFLTLLALLALRRVYWWRVVRRAARAHLDYERGHVARQQQRLEGGRNVRSPVGREPFGAYDRWQQIRAVMIRSRGFLAPHDLWYMAERALKEEAD